MAVPCPRCGREYDITLFQFGRTIQCTCGARVGPEKRIVLGAEGAGRGTAGPGCQERGAEGNASLPRPRFLADAMLGRLARWLRALGLDTAFDPEIADADLVRRAVEEGRYVLTRDRRLLEEWMVEGCLLVTADEPLEQLREVLAWRGLRGPWALFSRCLRCNTPLEAVSREAVAERLPPRVRERGGRLALCPTCDRVYWEGSHTRRMRRRLEETLGEG